mmetsp:Transcript_14071/g.35552  ORF Transcript_14071/g.35552 Transcript_14071/m.35552 type:complete len:151 (-) Transcript_14071:216-668(-)
MEMTPTFSGNRAQLIRRIAVVWVSSRDFSSCWSRLLDQLDVSRMNKCKLPSFAVAIADEDATPEAASDGWQIRTTRLRASASLWLQAGAHQLSAEAKRFVQGSRLKIQVLRNGHAQGWPVCVPQPVPSQRGESLCVVTLVPGRGRRVSPA